MDGHRKTLYSKQALSGEFYQSHHGYTIKTTVKMARKEMMKSKTIDSATALYLFHHVFLPSHLPQESDFTPEREMLLIQTTRDSLGELGRRVDAELADSIKVAEATMDYMLRAHKPLHDTISIDELELCSILQELSESGMLVATLHS